MKFILGKKLNMSQLYQEDDRVVPVTLVQAGPCAVVRVKQEKKDGYQAVQLGFGLKKKLNKPLLGQLKGMDNFRYLREFAYNDKQELKRGDRIDVSTFEVGDVVTVAGRSKGRGFQGVVKRHGFSGSPASHGHKDQLRMPGSIGATGPAHVFKGTKMAGRMGGTRVTVKNLEIIKIDKEKNILAIKGAIPGARGGLVLLKAEGELKVVAVLSPEKADSQPGKERLEPAKEVVREETAGTNKKTVAVDGERRAASEEENKNKAGNNDEKKSAAGAEEKEVKADKK